MIRQFIISLIRLFIMAFAVYVAFALVKVVMRVLRGDIHLRFRRSNKYPQQNQPDQPPEEYKDVKDARFVELPKEQSAKHNDEQDEGFV